MSSPDRKLPAWLLERVRLGELPAPLPADTRRRLEGAGSSEEDVERLAREDAAFLQAHPPETFLRGVRARRAPAEDGETVVNRSMRWLAPGLGVALAAAAAIALIVARPPDDEGVRLKGLAPGLSVFRKTANGSEALGDGAHVHAGDVLQLRYRPAGRRFGVIVSVDGVEQVTLHFPEPGSMVPGPLETAETTLAHGYRLDAAPRFERFLFVTSDQPLDPTAVVSATHEWARRGYPVSGPAMSGAEISSLTLLKDLP